jgi:hypothetical protein
MSNFRRRSQGSPEREAPREEYIFITQRFWLQALALLLAIAIAVGVALYTLRPPEVVPASAPTTEFSAERAMEDLKAIADHPHPVGSQEHAETREYLLGEIRALDLEPRVQTTTAVVPFPNRGFAHVSRVRNILVRLEGTADTDKAVLLSAHYDTFSGSTPSASDCGSCVVTLLETMRALETEPTLKNDVIFLFTDAEERVSAGARGFVEDDPWAEDAGMILNFEAAGSHGPAMVLATSEQNGVVVDGLLEASPRPVVNSLLPFLLGPIPGGDDMEVYKEELDAAGLDFVYFVDRSVYHTAADNLRTIDPRSVQHDGSYALSLTRHFGNISLVNLKAPDELFFTVLPGLTVHYSETWSLPLTIVLILAFLGIVVLGFVRGRLSVGKLVLGVLASVLVLIAAVVLTTLLWILVEKINPEYEAVLTLGFITYNGSTYLLAFAAFTVAITAAAFVLLGGRMGMANLAGGAMLWWVVFLVLTGLYTPDIGYLFAWPFTSGLVALGWILFSGEWAPSWLGMAVLAVATIPAVLIFVPAVFILFHAAGVALPGLPVPIVGFSMFFVALFVGLLVPQLALLARTSSRWLIPGLAALVCLVFLGVGELTAGFDAEHPKPNIVSYELDTDTKEAVWKSPGEDLDEWTSQFFSEQTRPASYATFLLPGFLDLDGIKGPAPSVGLPPPTVEPLEDTLEGGTRTLRLRVASSRGAPNAAVSVQAPGEIVAASVDGKEIERSGVPNNRRDRLAFSYAGMPEKGFELSLTVDSSEPVEVTVQDISEGLPEVSGSEVEPREPWMMPLQTQAMDPTKVKKSFVFEGRQ